MYRKGREFILLISLGKNPQKATDNLMSVTFNTAQSDIFTASWASWKLAMFPVGARGET